MNERITELQKQCVIHDRGTVLDFDYDKFAELIVRECAKVSERTGSLNEADFEGEMIADAIKEHFGVEK